MKTEYFVDIDLGNTEWSVAFDAYRTHVRSVVEHADFTEPESSLATEKDELMKTGVRQILEALGSVRHVVLIGIGGSSLGTEAIHAALKGGSSLHVLDSIEPHRIAALLEKLEGVSPQELAVCAVSKSGNTTETLTNTAVFLDELGTMFGTVPYDRLVCIGDPDNPLLRAGEELGAHILPMHESVGGRFSVFTAAGLVPLALLEHDIDALLAGVLTSVNEHENDAAEGAQRLYQLLEGGVRTVNFFAFDSRLSKLGYWYRQLTAESLGKETDLDGKKLSIGFIPTISTPVELHSIGQLYFSGFSGVFTDFVFFAGNDRDYTVPEDSTIAAQLKGKTTHEIHEAICGGVIGAYEKRDLPHRKTALAFQDEHDLGLFMGLRMLETMYLAKLMQVNAFDQPNVELYKNITREILDS